VPWSLKRFQNTGQRHFVTFSCYQRRPVFTTDDSRRLFESALERVHRNFQLRVYAHAVMPEHIHLLVSEPHRGTLADALKSLKQSISRRLIGMTTADTEHFWQKRYYDFNIRNYPQFLEKDPLHSSESRQARVVQASGGLAVEQLSSLRYGWGLAQPFTSNSQNEVAPPFRAFCGRVGLHARIPLMDYLEST
jgi:putative transposase